MIVPLDFASLSKVPETQGCYWLLRLLPEEKPKVMGRVSADDPHGILYIGKSNNLRMRFKEMINQFNMETKNVSRESKSGHPASAEWHFALGNQMAHPISSIRYTWEEITFDDDVLFRELVYLVNYRDHFGEYPPWNQAPSNYKKYLPSDNPKGYGHFRYDPNCLTWLPPEFR